MPYCVKCGNELPEEAVYCPVCGTPVASESAPSAPSVPASGLKLAFWWERFVAWLLDSVIVGGALAILALFTFLLGQPLGAFTNYGLPSWTSIFFSFSLNSIILFIYWMFMEGHYGQSFGKMIMRIKVTRLDGRSVDMGRVAVASAGKAFFLFLDMILGWALYPRRRQRIFNYLSETIVIKVT